MAEITRRQLKLIIEKAYNIGYNDRANQEGYNIAVLQLKIDTKKHNRPRHVTMKRLFQQALEAGVNQ